MAITCSKRAWSFGYVVPRMFECYVSGLLNMLAPLMLTVRMPCGWTRRNKRRPTLPRLHTRGKKPFDAFSAKAGIQLLFP